MSDSLSGSSTGLTSRPVTYQLAPKSSVPSSAKPLINHANRQITLLLQSVEQALPEQAFADT